MKQCRISRREFITKATGAALAFPTILPASVLGRDGKVAPSERINMGMLGVGARGLGNTRNFLGLDDVRIGAICDVNQTHLSRASQAISEQSESNDLKSYTDFRELNADPSIDAIMMALPVHWHTIPSLDAIAQGKHIYYEKPIALSLKEAQMVRAAVKKHNIIFQFGTQQRSSIYFRWASELAMNGRLGEIQKIEVGVPGGEVSEEFPEEPIPEWVDWERWSGPAPSAPFNEKRLKRSFHELIADYSLGMISCWGIHHMDIANWGNGTDSTGPVSVEGTGNFPKTGTCDTVLDWRVRFEFEKAPPIEFSDQGHHRMGVNYVGDQSSLHVTRGAINPESKGFLRDPNNKEDALPTRLPVSANHYRNFIDAIRNGSQPIAPIDSAVRSDTLCQLALIAIKCGRKLQWDPKKEQFVNDARANGMLQPRKPRSPWKLPPIA